MIILHPLAHSEITLKFWWSDLLKIKKTRHLAIDTEESKQRKSSHLIRYVICFIVGYPCNDIKMSVVPLTFTNHLYSLYKTCGIVTLHCTHHFTCRPKFTKHALAKKIWEHWFASFHQVPIKKNIFLVQHYSPSFHIICFTDWKMLDIIDGLNIVLEFQDFLIKIFPFFS